MGKVSQGENVIWGKCHMGNVPYGESVISESVIWESVTWGKCHMGEM